MELSSNWKKLQANLNAFSEADTKTQNHKLKEFPEGPNARKRKSPHSGDTKTSVKTRRTQLVPPERYNNRPAIRRMSNVVHQQPSDIEHNHNPGIHTRPSSSTSLAAPVEVGKYVAIDCEMVGTDSVTPFAVKSKSFKPSEVTGAFDYSILARVSVVSYTLETVYDSYVLPPHGVQVSDYRTKYSGITRWHLDPANASTNPIEFAQAQEEVSKLLLGKILVGHAVGNDLRVLGLSHPRRDIRDTAKYVPYRTYASGGGALLLGNTRREGGNLKRGFEPPLRVLVKELLGRDIQGNQGHDSVEDAKATMELFKREKSGFEDAAAQQFGRRPPNDTGNGTMATSAEREPFKSDQGVNTNGEKIDSEVNKKKKKHKRKKR